MADEAGLKLDMAGFEKAMSAQRSNRGRVRIFLIRQERI